MHRPYHHIPTDTELGRELAALGEAFLDDPEIAAKLATAAPGAALVADAKLRIRGNGKLQLRRFYASLQQAGGAAQPFYARTLQYYAAEDAPSWHTFPDDPDLGPMRAALADRDAIEVLSYVPLRRATLRRRSDHTAQIVKFKRRERFEQAARLQARVAEHHAALPFRVAARLDIDPSRQCFSQQALPGRCLSGLIEPANAADWLARAGPLQAALHRLPPTGWPAAPDEGDAKLANDCAWLTLLAPECAATLAACRALLAREPLTPAQATFCHGDFTCSQLLVDDDGWALVDFDRCHRGDRHRDLAIFIASLGYDPPALAAALAAGQLDGAGLRRLQRRYLDAYRAHSSAPVDPVRLQWQLGRAELHYLALLVKKNRYQPRAFQALLGNLLQTCRELAR